MYDCHDYVVEMREQELIIIIEEEKLKPIETRKFLEKAFREGEVKTVGTDIDKIMPPVSRFGGGNRAAKKKTVIDRLKAYFEKFYGIGGIVKFINEGEEN
jgi:type I restriction enzyme R subunit